MFTLRPNEANICTALGSLQELSSHRLTYVSRTAFVEGVVKIFSNFISTLPGSTED